MMRTITDTNGESLMLYGAAPPPAIGDNWISLNQPGASLPGRWLYPTTVSKEAGVAIRQYYYLKHKPDMCYMLTDKKEGKVAELSKGAIDLTMGDAKLVAKALIETLERFGYPRSSFLN
ncbi:MAG: hypothetical protein GY847_06400 [Proteobacteria bacterium]|nr:hypothetical protein [Pseudomonadota bacterium]